MTLMLKKCNLLFYTSRRGYTALHFAAQQNKVDIARILIEAGAKVDIKTIRTPGDSMMHSLTPLNLTSNIEIIQMIKARQAQLKKI